MFNFAVFLHPKGDSQHHREYVTLHRWPPSHVHGDENQSLKSATQSCRVCSKSEAVTQAIAAREK